MLLLIVFLVNFLTEITSNTAVVSMLVPVLLSIAETTGSNPVMYAVAAAVSASMAFMLPVATPPNALVFSKGFIKIGDMVRAGFLLNLIGWFLTVAIVGGIGGVLFGLF
jgi:sodium-dependent dicarboxylate transporter 2/3/5